MASRFWSYVFGLRPYLCHGSFHFPWFHCNQLIPILLCCGIYSLVRLNSTHSCIQVLAYFHKVILYLISSKLLMPVWDPYKALYIWNVVISSTMSFHLGIFTSKHVWPRRPSYTYIFENIYFLFYLNILSSNIKIFWYNFKVVL